MNIDISTLTNRAKILENVRAFFAAKNILEVETPLLCSAPVTDPFLHALSFNHHSHIKYLQTSPEYAMKRLLCQHPIDMYQMCKAFRQDESGRLHNLEFTMLEWYRIGFNHHDLMQETDEFLQTIIQTQPAVKYSYQKLFEKFLNVNPHSLSNKDLIYLCKENHISIQTEMHLDKDDYLNLLLTHVIEPQLKITHSFETPVFIYDYPEFQAALAKINLDKNQQKIAERFEVYINGIELANGYHELQDAKLQHQRFQADIEKRKKLQLPMVPIDEKLISALNQGLPACAGIALGIDRLIMIALEKNSISEVIAFDFVAS